MSKIALHAPHTQVGMGRDHTLYSLVEGHVKFSRQARNFVTPIKGRKWKNRPWKKFVNVTAVDTQHKLVLTGTA